MSYKSINLAQKLCLFDEQWQPKVIAEMNNYQFKRVRARRLTTRRRGDQGNSVTIMGVSIRLRSGLRIWPSTLALKPLGRGRAAPRGNLA